MNTFMLCCVPSADDKSYVLKYFVEAFDDEAYDFASDGKNFLNLKRQAHAMHLDSRSQEKNVVAEKTFLLARNINLARRFVGHLLGNRKHFKKIVLKSQLLTVLRANQ